MARSDYHVNVNGKVQITVEIKDTPIRMHLTLDDGQTWTFDYKGTVPGLKTNTATADPAPSRALVTLPTTFAVVTPLRPPRSGGTSLVKKTQTSSSGSSLEYIDPDGSGM